jgi:hypothetical protein
MAKEILLGQVVEINSDESNDIFMSLHIRLLTNKKNLNNARFTDGFINSVIENRDFYNCMPLVCERKKIEYKQYEMLGHAKNEDGTFETDQIGSFTSFYSKYNKEKKRNELFGVAKVFKRFPKICEGIQELYEQDKLFFSVEVYVAEYLESNKNERVIDAHEGNKLIGDCIVSYPAEKTSVAEILIAEDKEGENMADNKKTEKDFFEKTVMIESSELDLSQIQSKVYSKCREKMGSDVYDYYCSEFGYNYIILRSYETSNLHKIDYSVNNDEVDISEMYEVKKTYVLAEAENMKDGEKTAEISENNTNKNEDTIKDLNSKIKALEKSNSENESKIVELNNSIESKDKEILEAKQNINLLSEEVVSQKNEIAELNKSKTKLENLEKEIAENKKVQKQTELNEKYSKLLSKEVMESDEVKNAILELNSNYLKDLVINSALEKANKEKEKEVITASINDPIDLNGGDFVSKYITRN